jgi:galactonate dehydratase
VLYRVGFYRGGAIHMSALAGIDQALWDIKGKASGRAGQRSARRPSSRQDSSVYSWIGGDRPSRHVAATTRAVVERGFTAVKMNGSEELQFLDTFEKVDLALSTTSRPCVTQSARTSASVSTSMAACTSRWPRC